MVRHGKLIWYTMIRERLRYNKYNNRSRGDRKLLDAQQPNKQTCLNTFYNVTIETTHTNWPLADRLKAGRLQLPMAPIQTNAQTPKHPGAPTRTAAIAIATATATATATYPTLPYPTLPYPFPASYILRSEIY